MDFKDSCHAPTTLEKKRSVGHRPAANIHETQTQTAVLILFVVLSANKFLESLFLEKITDVLSLRAD